MTRVYCEKDGNWYTVQARGHADGSPEVCAAVSGLLYALAGYAENDREIRILGRKLESGDFSIVFMGRNRAKAVYNMTLIGLLQIEKSHPEYISVYQGTARKFS